MATSIFSWIVKSCVGDAGDALYKIMVGICSRFISVENKGEKKMNVGTKVRSK